MSLSVSASLSPPPPVSLKSINKILLMFLKTLTINSPYNLTFLFLRIFPREIKYIYSHIKTCTHVFIEALFITSNYWKSKFPSTGECINQMWSIHIMKCHSAKKRNEGLIHTSTCTNLKNFI